MAGRRRTQRSVRVSVAALLVGAAALVVLVALLVGSLLLMSVAAVLSALAGAAAARIVYNELLQTRRDAATARAAQARSFLATLEVEHAEQLAYSATMSQRIREREELIDALSGSVERATQRADEAETRVQREARRANEAQDRLAALLDEVLGTARYDVDADRQGDLTELPAIVNLLGWDAKLKAS